MPLHVPGFTGITVKMNAETLRSLRCAEEFVKRSSALAIFYHLSSTFFAATISRLRRWLEFVVPPLGGKLRWSILR